MNKCIKSSFIANFVSLWQIQHSTHRLIAATVEEVIVLASDGVGVRVSVEPRTEDAEQPGMEPLLAATVPVPAGGRFNRSFFCPSLT